MGFDTIRRVQHSLRDMVTTAWRLLDAGARDIDDAARDRAPRRPGDATASTAASTAASRSAASRSAASPSAASSASPPASTIAPSSISRSAQASAAESERQARSRPDSSLSYRHPGSRTGAGAGPPQPALLADVPDSEPAASSLGASGHSAPWPEASTRPLYLPLFATGATSTEVGQAREPGAYQAEIRRGLLPAFSTLTPRQVQRWLANQPAVTADIASVLTDTSGDPDLIALARAQANLDGSRLREAIANGPGPEALSVLDRHTRVLTDINARIEYGSRLTPAEAAYIGSWTTTVGALNLGRLPSLVRRSLEAPLPERTGPIRRDAVVARLGPVADAVLHFSNPDRHQLGAVITDGRGQVALATMPRSIQVLTAVRTDDTARADLNRRVLSGWSRLMASASENVAGGRAFSLALAHQALALNRTAGLERGSSDARDELRAGANSGSSRTGPSSSASTAAQATRPAIVTTGSTGAGPGSINTSSINSGFIHSSSDATGSNVTSASYTNTGALSTAPSSIERSAGRLLRVAARHGDAAADLIIDDAARASLLSQRWADDRGVVDVIAAGTNRDPADGGGGDLQARATSALISALGLQGPHYLNLMTEATSDAIVDVGIAWIDRFGRRGEHHGLTPADPTAPDLAWSATTECRFLRFVAATGDADAIRFHAAARHQAQALLTTALVPDHSARSESPMGRIGRLDGRILAADIRHQLERPPNAAPLDETCTARQRQAASLRLAAEVFLLTPPGQPAAAAAAAIPGGSGGPVGTALLNTTSAKVQAGYLNALFEGKGPPVDAHALETSLSANWLATLIHEARSDQRRLLVQAALDAGLLPIDELSAGAVQLVNGQAIVHADAGAETLDQACIAIALSVPDADPASAQDPVHDLERVESDYLAGWLAGLEDAGLDIRAILSQPRAAEDAALGLAAATLLSAAARPPARD